MSIWDQLDTYAGRSIGKPEGVGVKCKCGSNNLRVQNTVPGDGCITRWRVCNVCQHGFATSEVVCDGELYRRAVRAQVRRRRLTPSEPS